MARHDAPAAPARFASRKLRVGRKVRNATRTDFAVKNRSYKNYEKLREIFQIGALYEWGDFLGNSMLLSHPIPHQQAFVIRCDQLLATH